MTGMIITFFYFSYISTGGKVFADRGSLRFHNRAVHEGIKYQCDLCDKSYLQEFALKKHVKHYHEGEKEFVCQMCGKAFTSPNYLRHHIAAVHEGSRKYKCKFCSKSYAHQEGMNNHIRTVHEGVKYQCEFCEKTFTQSNNLKLHIAKQHEEISTVALMKPPQRLIEPVSGLDLSHKLA